MRKPLFVITLFGSILWLSSCIAPKDARYFQNLAASADTSSTQKDDSSMNSIIIQPYDLLDIRINTTEKALESLTQSQTSGSVIVTGPATTASPYVTSFLVDAMGNVNLPLVGEVTLKGLTIKKARIKIADIMKSYIRDPFVDVKFLTFRVTMLGEFNHPGTITVSNEKADLLDAIALASDVTEFGNKKEVMVLRGDPRKPKVYMIDLTNTTTFKSPGFNLQPNDIVYVEATRRKYLSENFKELGSLIVLVNTLLLATNIYISLRKLN